MVKLNIYLSDLENAKFVLEQKRLTKNYFNDLRLVGRYYLNMGYSKNQAREKIDEFMLACGVDCKTNVFTDKGDNAIKAAERMRFIVNDSIYIFKHEMDVIDSLDGIQLRKIAFTLLCLAKYWDLKRDNNNHWIYNKDSEIMSMANVAVTTRRQSELYRKLQDYGLVRFSRKVDGTSMMINFLSNEGACVLAISDFRNLGYQYLRFHGGAFFSCENCGVTTRATGKNHKYCQSCAAKIHTRQKVNSVMKRRKLCEECNC